MKEEDLSLEWSDALCNKSLWSCSALSQVASPNLPKQMAISRFLVCTTTWSLAWLNILHGLKKKWKPFLLTAFSSSTPNPQNLWCTRASAHCNVPLKPEVQQFWISIQALKSFCTPQSLNVLHCFQMSGLESTLFFFRVMNRFQISLRKVFILTSLAVRKCDTLSTILSRCSQKWSYFWMKKAWLTEEITLETPETTLYQDRMRS